MLEANDLLVKCPKCGTWPMAVQSRKETFAQREISFKCPKCGSEEQGRLGRTALSPVSAPRGLDAA